MSGMFEPRDADYKARVKASFARQHFMELLGITMVHVAPGECDLILTPRQALHQQHGFVHAGATTTMADSAAGYAASTLFEANNSVLTTEFKMNLLNPARGDRLVARGRVIKPGRTLTICRSDVFGITDETETHLATGLFTMMAVSGLRN